MRQFDGATSDISFWSKTLITIGGEKRHMSISRIELSLIGTSMASQLSIPNFKQMAFRQLGYRRLTDMKLCAQVLSRIANAPKTGHGGDDSNIRTSTRSAYGPIVLLLK